MKVILLEDVVGAGKAGDVVEVASGYARNKLLPSGIAIEANKVNMKTLEHRRAKIAAKRAEDVATAQALADRLNEKELTFTAKAGEGGKLFGSITAQDIADAIAEKLGFEIDKKKILLDSSIKELGTHDVQIRIFTEVIATVKVIIDAEGGVPAAVVAAEAEAARLAALAEADAAAAAAEALEDSEEDFAYDAEFEYGDEA
jgi:large subunit ribosomal protein L9